MEFAKTEIEKLALLARLRLDEAEILRLQKDLTHIVGYVEGLKKVNVDGVVPMTHAVPMDLPLRADKENPVVGRRGVAGSAGYQDGLVKVPKIIE